jgi:hypothetical protein
MTNTISNDIKTTTIGLVMAGGIAAIDYFSHLGPDGLDLKKETFWLGLVVAALMGLKGYYTNKSNTTIVQKTQTVEVTTPTNP